MSYPTIFKTTLKLFIDTEARYVYGRQNTAVLPLHAGRFSAKYNCTLHVYESGSCEAV